MLQVVCLGLVRTAAARRPLCLTILPRLTGHLPARYIRSLSISLLARLKHISCPRDREITFRNP